MRIFTVGHSTHPIEKFLELVGAHGVDAIVDIRTIPKSRHNPQFEETSLARSLHEAELGYVRLASLGGRRSTSKNSPNGAWRNASFRGYADYMQTTEFAAGIEELRALAELRSIAIMCAEAVPWRCHRSLVGDALLVRGDQVFDIMSTTIAKPETLTSFAKVEGTSLTYPPE